jgi:L-fuconolactonase
MIKIDAHQHFWQYNAQKYEWISPSMKAIKHDFLPKDIANILVQQDISGTVLVQVQQNDAENEQMLQYTHENTFIKGIVAWLAFADPLVAQKLAFYNQFKQIKGFRHILQAENTAEFLLNPAFLNGIDQLQSYNYTYDILVNNKQMDDALAFVRQFPKQKFVLDHIAKPDIKNGEFKTWAKKIKQLGQVDNLSCKLSGMVTENDWNLWTEADFEPYMQETLAAFGAKRLMFGSDWPVCMLAASYSQVTDIVQNFITSLSTNEQEDILGKNAIEFYNLAM